MHARLAAAILLAAGPRGVTPAEERPPIIELSFEGTVGDAARGFRGKVEGDEIEFRPGRKGQALFVGGTEDWATVKFEPVPDLSKGFTAELWLRRDDWENPYKGGSGWQTVVAMDGFSVEITAPGCPTHEPWAVEARVGKRLAKTRLSLSSPAGAIRPEIWYHVALVYDPKARETRLYLDGLLLMDESTPPDLERKTSEPPELVIGTWFKANQAFRGLIDEFRIYDYPRSESEVRRSASEGTVLR